MATKTLINPLSPNIHIQILSTGLYTILRRISWENLVDQGILLGDNFINSPNLFSSCFVDIVRRILMLVTFGTWMGYRKIPKISPGAYIFQRPFFEGLIFEGVYIWREICVSKSIGLALFLLVLLCSVRTIFQAQALGGLIFWGAYFRNFTVTCSIK